MLSSEIKTKIMKLMDVKYYWIILDFTPNVSHQE